MTNAATGAIDDQAIQRSPQELIRYLMNERPLGLDDPYSLYASLREQAPIYHDGNDFWALTRYEDVSKALRHRGMSTRQTVVNDPRFATSVTLQTMVNNMLFFDDPKDQLRQRRLVGQAFTSQTVSGLQPFVESLVSRLLDDCLERGSFDFMHDFVEHIPVAVICHMLGVPDEDIETFREWNFLITSATGVNLPSDHLAKVDGATTSLNAYLGALLEERTKNPRDDLITRLIEARDNDDRLTPSETAGLAHLLLVAGSDTTSAFLGAAMTALSRFPGEFARLRAERDLLPNAIEELMRVEAPVHFGLMRVTLEPLVLDDVEIPVGHRVWTLFSAGNRDPLRFEDPDTLDLGRADPRHLGFGWGPHVCLGAPLARMESAVTLTALLDRTSALEITESDVPWLDHGNLRSIQRLMVETRGGAE